MFLLPIISLYTSLFMTILHSRGFGTLHSRNRIFPYLPGSAGFGYLLGLIVSDGHLKTRHVGSASYAHHCNNPLFARWLIDDILPLMFTGVMSTTFDAKGFLHSNIYSLTYPYLYTLWQSFYFINSKGAKIKTVPYALFTRYFDASSLAMMFMCDGSYAVKDRTVVFSMGILSLADVQFIVDLLRVRFGLLSTINAGNGSLSVRLSTASVELFYSLVVPFMHHTYYYKVPRNYLPAGVLIWYDPRPINQHPLLAVNLHGTGMGVTGVNGQLRLFPFVAFNESLSS